MRGSADSAAFETVREKCIVFGCFKQGSIYRTKYKTHVIMIKRERGRSVR